MTIRWKAFPLHPDTPMEGLTLEDLFKGRNKDIGAMKARLKQVADQEGLPFGDRTHTYNSRLAQELGKWADTQENGHRFHDAVFRAYFVDGRNIAQTGVLMDIVESTGLQSDEARTVIENRGYKEAVDSDWSLARSLGITAVPTLNLDGQFLVGAQPFEVMRQFVRQNSIPIGT